MKSNEYMGTNNSPLKTSQSKTSSQYSRIDLKQSALDSKRLLASQVGHPFLDTISSNESRYTGSPNFMMRTNEMKHHIVTLPQQKFNQYESMSYSASSDFGQHSLRSSIEQQQLSARQFYMADQIRQEQYQLKMMQNHTILEDSKEEDVSFNRTMADNNLSPNNMRNTQNNYNLRNQQQFPGNNTGNIENDDNKSAHQNMSFQEDTSGSYLKNTSTLGMSGIAGMAKPNLNISQLSQNSQINKYLNRNSQMLKGSFQNNTKNNSKNQDDELLEELTKGGIRSFDQNQPEQYRQQILNSLEMSDEDGYNNNNNGMNSLQSSIEFQSTLKKVQRQSQQQQQPLQKSELIKIDDNQFVTLSQVPQQQIEAYGQQQQHEYYNYQQRQDSSNRPSTLSNYFNYPLANYSDGTSSSHVTTNQNTPYQNQYQSRTISPYYQGSRRDNGGASSFSHISSQKSQPLYCECCKGPLSLKSARPISGLSDIQTKNIDYSDAEEIGLSTPKLPSENDQSTKMMSSNNNGLQVASQSYRQVLCQDCQSKILNKDNTPLQSDLRVSQLLQSHTQSNPFQYKSQFSNNNDENLNINSNLLSSIQQQNVNHLKLTSSLLGQSELQYSNFTLSNNNPQINSQGQQKPALQVNLLQSNSDSNSHQNSLQFLSKLSSEIGPSIKYQSEQLNAKYGSLNSTDNYKMALKSFVNRQFERNAKNEPLQYSRIFREKQTKRMFDQLQSIKGEMAKSYEDLEAMHINILLSKAYTS